MKSFVVLTWLLAVGLVSPAWARFPGFPNLPRAVEEISLDFSAGADEMPVPPQQYLPWPHPNDPVANTAARLFDLGLADPRGCQYREVRLSPGSGSFRVRGNFWTHAWVIPGGTEGRRFAVAWNGLVYPVSELGYTPSLEEDIRIISGMEFEKPGMSLTEPAGWGQDIHTLVQAALLLRLGRENVVPRRRSPLSEDRTALDEMADDWLRTLMSRAVRAHCAGDDRLALMDAELAADAYARVEPNLWAQRPSGSPRTLVMGTYYPYLRGLPQLISDSRRRLSQDPGPAAEPGSLAAEIAGLENIAVPREEDGWVPLGRDPRIQALVQRGDEAVEPLLATIEDDHRLTRTVVEGRYFDGTVHFISVATAANTALSQILSRPFRVWNDDPEVGDRGVHRYVAEMREYWARTKSRPAGERWYESLADNGATPATWAHAARAITGSARARWIGTARILSPNLARTGAAIFWEEMPGGDPRADGKMAGEALRAHGDPSVSELLARRSDAADRKLNAGEGKFTNFGYSMELALALAQWDPVAAQPVLRRRIREFEARPYVANYAGPWPAELMRGLADNRLDSAWPLLACWLRHNDFRFYPLTSADLAAVERGRDRPEVKAALQWLFNNRASEGYNVLDGKLFDQLELLESTPLADSEAFLNQARRALKNKTLVGFVYRPTTFASQARQKSLWRVLLGNKSLWIPDKGPAVMPPGGLRRIRVCDYFAWLLAQRNPGRVCPWDATEEQQDEAVAYWKNWLERRQRG